MNVYALQDAICAHLSSRPDHVARILLGAACETWLNAEACVALNWATPRVLPEGRYVFPEHRKRDLVVCCGDAAALQVCCRMEAKAIYANKNIVPQLRTLEGQLQEERAADEDATAIRIGLVYAIWLSTTEIAAFATPEGFLHQLEETTSRLFSEPRYRLSQPTFRTVLPCIDVDWDGTHYGVALSLALITRTPLLPT